ncbi:N-acetylmuramoyl-L-alanine amidase family protein [Flagellimonas flava]|uniref:N-acetylmuramoyl-L-alanine amidase family protein n=1 Tax=Flagellimonas flava TaxID=570519 RepID=UPI003D65FA92
MKPFKILLMVLFLVPLNALFSQEKKVIIIDAGHGGTDSGAIGTNKAQEKDITLAIAKAMLLYNRTLLDNPYELYLTRYEDTLISLSHRTQLVRALKPDLFISLHCNHAKNEKATGIEMYLHNKTNLKNENQMESKIVALSMIEMLTKRLGYRNRGIKRANFQVLRESITTSPAILAELGFLSNTDEASYLELKRNSNAVALALLMSIKI